MRVLVTAVAAATLFLSSALSPAFADTVTAKVKLWNADTKILTLDSNEEFPIDVGVELPEDLKVGDTVTIDYSSTEDGVTAVFSVKKAG